MSNVISGGAGANGKVSVLGKDNTPLAELIATDTESIIGVGNKGRAARLTMYDTNGSPSVNLRTADASLILGGATNGKVSVHDKQDLPTVELLALDKEAVIGVGNKGHAARLTMYDGNGNPAVTLTTSEAALTLGGTTNGKVSVHDKQDKPAVELLALDTEAVIGAGNKGHAGRLTMYDGNGNSTINLKTADATLTLGGPVNGKVSVLGADNNPVVELIATTTESVIGLGQAKRPGRLTVYDGNQNAAIELNAATGDIWIANADFAEEFDLASVGEQVEPQRGMVMTLREDGTITPSSTRYDTKVVGVVSGAGDYRPGLVLDRRTTGHKRLPIALLGKVYCWVDATEVPVQVGDLLTTAAKAGHAMRATDRYAAFGAVLGKALASLSSGVGLIPILINLQ